jgi:hypothetical protein
MRLHDGQQDKQQGGKRFGEQFAFEAFFFSAARRPARNRAPARMITPSMEPRLEWVEGTRRQVG